MAHNNKPDLKLWLPTTKKEMDISIAPEHPVLRGFYEAVEQG